MTPPLRTKVKHLHSPKTNETERDYQDHFEIRIPDAANPNVVAAIADGATDSAFAARWAQELTRLFVEHPPLNEQGELTDIHDWLKPAQHAWHKSVQWDSVPWHGIDKARQGAVATFLGITIQPNDDHTLKIQSIAVGDCELFVIDPNDQVTFNFPLADASQFNNRPDLICSQPKNNVNLDQQVRHATISILPHDRVILTTDALAEWMLTKDTSPAMYRQILQMNNDQFKAWLQSERDCRNIKNDDATILSIEFTRPESTTC